MTMILPALFGAGAAAGSATAGLGSGLLSVSGLLSGVATVGGVLAQIAAGNAQAESYKAQAFASKMEAGNEEIQGVQRQTRMKRELMRILGESDVNYAAAGIDLSGGVSKEARDTAETRATQEINIDRQMTESKRQMLLAQAATYRRMAKQARQTGFLNAFATAASGVGGMVG